MSKEKLIAGKELEDILELPHSDLIDRLISSYKRAMVELLVSRRILADIMRSEDVKLTPDLLEELYVSARRAREFLDEFNRQKPSMSVTCPRCNLVIYGEEKP